MPLKVRRRSAIIGKRPYCTNSLLNKTQTSLTIVGGGLAGIAAAESAQSLGYQTVLYERNGVLGGRVASFFEPIKKQWIDIGQHLLLGCCTEVLALHQRLGLDQFYDRYDTTHFATLHRQHWSLTSSPYLPQRLQLLPSFLTMPMVPILERLKTGLLLKKLADETLTDISVADWFKQHEVTHHSIDAFWNPLILSTLNEMPEYAAAKALQKVIRACLGETRNAMSVYLPKIPLREIYHDNAAKALKKNGVTLQFYKRLRRIHWEKYEDTELPTIKSLEFSDGTIAQSDQYILALPTSQLWKVLDASALTESAEKLRLERFEPGAVTTVHLWLNRPVLEPDKRYCVLAGGIGQFVCRPNNDIKNYYTVVISAAHRLLNDTEMTAAGSADLAHRILEQLKTTFESPDLQLLHCRTTTCFEATFSPQPLVYANRPESSCLFENGTISGDWTQTGFPATLEGAVRSGLVRMKADATLPLHTEK